MDLDPNYDLKKDLWISRYNVYIWEKKPLKENLL